MLKSIIATWSTIILSALSVFILYPFLVSELGEEQYGIWLLIVSITGYFALIQMGVPLANSRFLAKYLATDDELSASTLLSTNLAFFGTLGFIVLLLGFAVSYLLGPVFGVSDEYLEVARYATWIATLEISLRFIFEVFEGLIHAKERFVYLSVVKNIATILRVGLAFALVDTESGLVTFALVVLASGFLYCLLLYLYCRLRVSNITPRFNLIKKSAFLTVFSFGAYVMLMNLAGRVSIHSAPMVLASMVNVQAIVYYGIASSLMLYLMEFINAFTRVLLPRFTKLNEQGSKANFESQYFRFSRYLVFLLVPICGLLFLFGHSFIELWMGERFATPAHQVLSILALGYGPLLVQRGSAIPILLAAAHMRPATIMFVVGAILNLALSLYWGSKHGMIGVAWGTTVPNLFMAVASIFLMRRSYRINMVRYFTFGLLLPACSGLPLVVAYFLAPDFFTATSYIELGWKGVSVAAAYYLLVLLLFSNKDERSRFSEMTKSFTSATK